MKILEMSQKRLAVEWVFQATKSRAPLGDDKRDEDILSCQGPPKVA